MDKKFDHRKHENNIYSLWLKYKVFTPKIDSTKKPYTIILPLPNANDPMHMGHALFTIEDILVRYHRMLGIPSLWLPGGDHAGIETQYVFEKKLKEKGKSRFDYDRDTLYKMIWNFTNENKDINKEQMKKLGFSMDWSRYHYSLEPEIVEQVLKTFRKLHSDNLIYRGERLVNYCARCGTSFSELEVNYKEREGCLYYIDYKTIKIATTRPETIFADVAVAVNPKDKRYKRLIGKKATIPVINKEIPIIAESEIDISFGTGALKVTPAHDKTDFEIGERNNLEAISIIGFDGIVKKLPCVPPVVSGNYVNKARKITIDLLEKDKVLVKKEPLTHSVGTCYKCKTVIEPLLMPQWFVKTKPLAKPAIAAVQDGKTKIFPKKRFEKLYFDWMENIKDWNISRQIVWGPRIPVWYCLDCNPDIQINYLSRNGKTISGTYSDLKKKHSYDAIKKGLQSLLASKDAKYQLENGPCKTCKSKHTLQETDTFDTWFLSGQWPLTTLGFNVDDPKKSSPDFDYFYPTSVLDTLWDILFFWVGRMMMFGLYLAEKVPFEVIHIHARVVDEHGQKMSKSKGNVVDPIGLIEKYGADALRMALTVGVAPASDIAISDGKVKGMRNFSNKIWNISRYVLLKLEESGIKKFDDLPSLPNKSVKLSSEDKKILKEFNSLIKSTSKGIEKYRFGTVSENLYHFVWHKYADKYLEYSKDKVSKDNTATLVVLRHILMNSLKLLHPFMPFATEAIWQEGKNHFDSPLLATSKWPKVN